MKFNEPAIEDIPARCILKIAVSTELPACAKKLLKGGYKVHPVPTPKSVNADDSSKKKEKNNNQKLKLFKRAKAIS